MSELNWDEILSGVSWHEFEHEGRKFRTGEYSLDGFPYLAVEVFLGSEAPTEGGWVGLRWAQKNDMGHPWPSEHLAKSKINGGISEPKKPARKVDPEMASKVPIPPKSAKRY